MRAHVLDFELERLLGALVGTLERHVLQKVRGAVGRVGFCAGPRVDPHTDCCCLRVRVRLGGYCQAVGESRDFGKGPWDVRRERSDMTRLQHHPKMSTEQRQRGKWPAERRTDVIFRNMLLRQSERASARLMTEI